MTDSSHVLVTLIYYLTRGDSRPEVVFNADDLLAASSEVAASDLAEARTLHLPGEVGRAVADGMEHGKELDREEPEQPREGRVPVLGNGSKSCAARRQLCAAHTTRCPRSVRHFDGQAKLHFHRRRTLTTRALE